MATSNRAQCPQTGGTGFEPDDDRASSLLGLTPLLTKTFEAFLESFLDTSPSLPFKYEPGKHVDKEQCASNSCFLGATSLFDPCTQSRRCVQGFDDDCCPVLPRIERPASHDTERTVYTITTLKPLALFKTPLSHEMFRSLHHVESFRDAGHCFMHQ